MDDQEISTNRIPRLLGQENYIKCKVLFEATVCYNDTEINSIKNGPCVPTEGANTNKVVERQMKKRDEKALSMLKLGLSWEILISVNHHTTVKAMYYVVVEMFEGNTELKYIKKDRLKQQLDKFKFKEGVMLKSVLQRFLAIVNEIRTNDLAITKFDLNKKLFSSLSAEQEMIENYMIKEEKPSFQVTNALIAPMENMSTKNQQHIPIIEEPNDLLTLQGFMWQANLENKDLMSK
ncbi:uncharacterized protein LOC143574303 [Bidens hawaiensis]|uniref:uncharacterized protein LOC143574303 n=1 Tax=Bidens hawaiensis TaxID=980011 RepID=UPI00404B8ED9